MNIGDLSDEHTDGNERPSPKPEREIQNVPAVTPLPKLQLFILLYLQLAEPLTSTVVYPFVNQLVRETGVTGGDERKTGYYAGFIESSFYATEAICVLQWGRLSDRFGRKPILLSGLVGLIISVVGFGLSKNYWALVLSRCAEGALNGNIGVSKSMMTEITDVTNRARGFAYLPMVWSLGSTIGPVIGGVFSNPTTRWPGIFGTTGFWAEYPYFLPCITVAYVSLTAFLIALFCLKEVRPRSHKPTSRLKDPENGRIIYERLPASDPGPSLSTAIDKSGSDTDDQIELDILERSDSLDIEGTDASINIPYHHKPHLDQEIQRDIGLRSILIPRVLLPVLNYGFLAFTDQAVNVLIPLMYSSSIDHGGLGFDPFVIGLVQGLAGLVMGFTQVLTFPRLLQKFGPKKLYIASYTSYLLVYCAFPVLSSVTKTAGGVTTWTWLVILLQLAAYSMTCLTWGCIFMYISEAAPSPATLGLTNGLAQTTSSVMCAIAPSASSSLFSASLEHNLSGGNFVYWFLCAFTVCGIVASSRLPSHLG
ncbi:MFS general substrate transporter [Obba rivulosa]|uniref:MFS general substrate transporter n=1 Tax=Obba rivulosa TaxID=1052685 RepID=A0A8E2AMS3_9APHY|nr:MFS general substrate transporter [Obba rivulosa]